MEIWRLGHSCFKIKTKDLTLIIDPYSPDTGYKPLKESCEVVLLTHHHSDHNYIEGVSDFSVIVDGPGEYEVGGVFIYGYSTFHDESQGTERGPNTIYLIEADELFLLHLGDLGHELSKETLENISHVDILMIPVGGYYTINSSKASKVISSLEPGIVIPMHYQDAKLSLPQKLDGVDKFLDEMGVEVEKNLDKLKVTKTDIPQETKITVLDSVN